MASMQKMAMPSLSTTSSYGSCRADAAAPEQFSAGLRVLVVDDDVTCLRILEHMLQRCRYRVTTCCQATIALSLLRERKSGYDVVISDIHMPDMDGFELLELVGLEMDLPVIMMSADGRTSTVMRGIKHGACDYLIKPVRIEDLKNIWQHVVRKKWNENTELDHSGSLEDRRVVDDADYASSVNDGADGTFRSQKKKRDAKDDDDGELDNEDPSASKKPQVVWSVELHQKFVSAVNQLGIEKAVPKRILELMNVSGLTRENIASHLQEKYQLRLKVLEEGMRMSSSGSSRANLEGKSISNGPLRRQSLGGSENISKLSPNGLQYKRSPSFQLRSSLSSSTSTVLKHAKGTSKSFDGGTRSLDRGKVISNGIVHSLNKSSDGNKDNEPHISWKGNPDEKPSEPANVDSDDCVSGLLYDILQEEVIALRKACHEKDQSLKDKDDAIEMLAKKVDTLTKAMEVEAKKMRREVAAMEKEVAAMSVEKEHDNRANWLGSTKGPVNTSQLLSGRNPPRSALNPRL